MKIEINSNSSTEAELIIDGRSLTVMLRPGMSQLKGISDEHDVTLGALFASKLHELIGEMIQAHAAAEEEDSPGDPLGLWTPLSDDAFEAAEDAMR